MATFCKLLRSSVCQESRQEILRDCWASVQIFVGGLDPSVGDEELKGVFGQYGELVYVKIPVGKGCGFVQYTHRYVR